MLDLFRARQQNLKNEVLSGLTVALALVPEAVAFAFVAGISPIIGLYSAFFIGLISAIFGGRPGMISGATGAMAVVVVSLIALHGIEYLFPTVILCGAIQLLVGAARLGVLIRMVPHSVMLGFVNGLAIVIFSAQLGSFKTVSNSGTFQMMAGPAMGLMLAMVALTMAIIWLLPKFTKAVPASLVAIVAVSSLGVALNRYMPGSMAAENQSQVVMTVGDMLVTNAKVASVDAALQRLEPSPGPTDVASGPTEAVAATEQSAVIAAAMVDIPREATSIEAGLPKPFFFEFQLPPANLTTLWIILPYALILAAVGLIESLMTLTLIDEMTDTRGNGNRECFGQGLANICCGLFGGMGGCAMIGQSLINVESGGRGRLSGIVAACSLLAFVLFLSSWIEMIPMAALVGIMFMVVIGTFEWASVRMYKKVPLTDYVVMLIVTSYTALMHDLATAVVLGVVVSSLAFAFKHAKSINADMRINEFGAKIYQLHGPLFFASTTQFKDLFDYKNDPDVVVVDFYYTRVYDHSGMDAIMTVAEKYEQFGKTLHLTHLSSGCRELIKRSGDMDRLSISDEPQFHLSTDRFKPLMGDDNSAAKPGALVG